MNNEDEIESEYSVTAMLEEAAHRLTLGHQVFVYVEGLEPIPCMSVTNNHAHTTVDIVTPTGDRVRAPVLRVVAVRFREKAN